MGTDTHPPRFDFYPQDFISDRRVMAMSAEQVGAYIRLLCMAWYAEVGKGIPPASVPNDDAKLATYTGLSRARWKRIKAPIVECFRESDDGQHLIQPRLEREWGRIEDRRDMARESANARWASGKRSAHRRHANAVRTQCERNANAMPTHDERICERNATRVSNAGQRPTVNSQKNTPLPPKGGGGDFTIPPLLDEPRFREAWDGWLAYLRRKRAPMDRETAELVLPKLAALGAGRAIDCIRMAKEKGWRSLAPDRMTDTAKPSLTPAQSGEGPRKAMPVPEDYDTADAYLAAVEAVGGQPYFGWRDRIGGGAGSGAKLANEGVKTLEETGS